MSGKGKAKVFEFGAQIHSQAPNRCKSTSTGSWPTSRELLLFFVQRSTDIELAKKLNWGHAP